MVGVPGRWLGVCRPDDAVCRVGVCRPGVLGCGVGVPGYRVGVCRPDVPGCRVGVPGYRVGVGIPDDPGYGVGIPDDPGCRRGEWNSECRMGDAMSPSQDGTTRLRALALSEQ